MSKTSMFAIRWQAAPLLALPLYSMATAVQACSEDAPSENGAVPPANSSAARLTDCTADEVAKEVRGVDVCCRASADNVYVCRALGEPASGMACNGGEAPRPVVETTVSFDSCMFEECGFQRTCLDYPSTTEARAGTLRCSKGDAGTVWTWEQVPDVHRMEEACLPYATTRCGDRYLTSTPISGAPDKSRWLPMGSSTVCVEAAETPVAINHRRLFLMSSTCSVGGGAPVDCSVDGWTPSTNVDARLVGVWRLMRQDAQSPHDAQIDQIQLDILPSGVVYRSTCAASDVGMTCSPASRVNCMTGKLVERKGAFAVDIPGLYGELSLFSYVPREREIAFQPDGSIRVTNMSSFPGGFFRRVAETSAGSCR